MNIRYFLFPFFLYASSTYSIEYTGKISHLITWQDGHSVISLENVPDNSCTSKKYYSLGVKGQDVKAEPMLSTALAAYLGNRNVRITSATGSCQGGEEKLISIQIMSN